MSKKNRSTIIILVILLIVPALFNIDTPLYNRTSPELGGLPFFYWFQIMLLLLCIIPYVTFTYVMKRSSGES